MKVPHKHAEVIKAWADGCAIEYNVGNDVWVEMLNPIWCVNNKYRIKPEPKADKISYGVIGYDGDEYHHINGLWNNTEVLPDSFKNFQYKTIAKIKIVIDGNDYTKVKSVEIIK